MTVRSKSHWGVSAAGAAVGVAIASYAAYAGAAWYRFGHPPPPAPDEADEFLDRFMPEYEVVERHQLPVDAPAAVAFAAAMKVDLQDSLIVRAIFKARELALDSENRASPSSSGLVDFAKALGWRVLIEVPDREIVMGAVTQPWASNPVFRGLEPEQFAAFADPDYVKIVWTLRADPVGDAHSVARTETRAIATNAYARSTFRVYWACVSPGVALIRQLSLRLVKKDAETAYRAKRPFYRRSGNSSETVVPPVGGTSM